MSIKIIGEPPKVSRFVTNFYSLDRAFANRAGDTGLPYGIATEVFGPTGCGKSTLIYGLSGLVAKHMKKNIVLADFEGFDPDFLTVVLETAKFSGDVLYISNPNDEEALDELISQLGDENNAVGILDSVGAISPISERDGSLGEANMGRRAKLMAQFSRKGIHLIREGANKTIYIVNHIHPNIGFAGITTPGGETLKYLSSIRIRVKRKEEFPDGSYVLEGKVIKNRWGYRDGVFHVFMLAGTGLHLGMSALYDGTIQGVVSRKKIVKIGEQSFGYMKHIVREAHDGNDEFFIPFLEALRENSEPEADSGNGEAEDTGTESGVEEGSS